MFKRRPVGVLFIALLFGLPYAGSAAPIPCGKDAPTRAAWCKKHIALRLREVECYRQHTKDPEKVRDRAAAFMTAMLTWWWTVSMRPYAHLDELYKQGNQVLADGSDDPIVLMWAGRAAFQVDQLQQAEARLDRARRQVGASAYPAKMKFSVHEMWRDFLFRTKRVTYYRSFLKEYISSGVQYLIEETAHSEPPRAILAHITDFIGTPEYSKIVFPYHEEFFQAVKKADGSFDSEPPAQPAHGTKPEGEGADGKAGHKAGKIDPYVMNVIAGEYYHSRAWYYRGGGWASTVTEKGARAFQENLDLAEKYFVKAWEIDPKLPQAPRGMISVAMGKGDDTRLWFDRAVAAQMDFFTAYEALSWSLRPRWGGSHEEMYRFGLECLDTKRFDTLVPYVLIDILTDIDGELGRQGRVWRQPGVYDNAARVFEGMEGEPIFADDVCTDYRHRWTMSQHAAAAIHAGRYDDVRRVLGRLGDRVRGEAFGRLGLSYPLDVARAFALSGSVHDDVARFEDLLADDGIHRQPARQKAQELLAATAARNNEAAARPYFESYKTILEWEDRFEQGQWVDLGLDTERLWIVREGKWKTASAQSVVGSSLLHQSCILQLDCRAEFRVPMEVELDVAAAGPAPGLYAGLTMGNIRKHRLDGFSTPGGGRLFWIHEGLDAAGVTAPGRPLEATNVPLAKPNHLLIQLWPDCFEYYVNGVRCPGGKDDRFAADGKLGLGTADWHLGPGEFRCGNFRVRKLTMGPPPPADDDEARVRYYTEWLRQRPDQGQAYLCRATAHHRRREYDEAIADCRKAAEMDRRMAGVEILLGLAHFDKGDYAEAAKQLDLNAKAHPNYAPALRALAWLLATCPEDKYRDGSAAVKHAQKACQLTRFADCAAVSALAAAYAESGDFTQAVKLGKKSVDLASEKEKAECRERLRSYEAEKPYRQSRSSEESNPPSP